eukprot:COSAG02_NODE_34414_length_484_cov_1.070130_1_plen_20_part_01
MFLPVKGINGLLCEVKKELV